MEGRKEYSKRGTEEKNEEGSMRKKEMDGDRWIARNKEKKTGRRTKDKEMDREGKTEWVERKETKRETDRMKRTDKDRKKENRGKIKEKW